MLLKLSFAMKKCCDSRTLSKGPTSEFSFLDTIDGRGAGEKWRRSASTCFSEVLTSCRPQFSRKRQAGVLTMTELRNVGKSEADFEDA